MESERRYKSVWIALFSLITAAIWIAWSNPASEYELSIYAGTPVVVWLILSFVLLASIVLLFIGRFRRLGYLSAGFAVFCWLSMRMIRGYHVIGIDTLVHLGTVQQISAGVPTSRILYPHMHVFVVVLSRMADLPTKRTLFLAVLPFTLILVAFVSLVTREVSERHPPSSSGTFGFLIGLCILPINWLGTNLGPHPSSLAVFFSSMFYFLVFRGITSWTRSMALLITVTAIALVVLHPMIALFVVISLAGMSLIFVIVRVVVPDNREAANNSVLLLAGMCLFLGTLVVYYLIGFDAFQGTMIQTILYITEPITAEGNPTDRAGRLSQIGRSAYVIAIKYAGANVVASIPVFVVTLLAVNRLRTGHGHLSDLIVVSLIGAMGALTTAALIFVAAGQTFYFRVLGLVMLLFSFVAAAGLCSVYSAGFLNARRIPIKTVSVVILVVIAGFSLPLMHPSPYIVNTSDHSTKAEVAVAETAISHGVSSPVITTREHFARLQFFVTGERTPIIRARVSDHFNDRDLPAEFDNGMYMFTTQSDYETDVILYRGFRFNESDFRYLNYETRLNRIITSGSADIYIISK
jgi:hypothetical protein